VCVCVCLVATPFVVESQPHVPGLKNDTAAKADGGILEPRK
jgi:hypothetical protein